MMITGVITLYTSDSNSPHVRAAVAQLTALGKFVILRPLSEIKQRKKRRAVIAPTLASTLATMNQN